MAVNMTRVFQATKSFGEHHKRNVVLRLIHTGTEIHKGRSALRVMFIMQVQCLFHF